MKEIRGFEARNSRNLPIAIKSRQKFFTRRFSMYVVALQKGGSFIVSVYIVHCENVAMQ